MLCHYEDKICYPEICVFVGLQSKQVKEGNILCLYVCSLCDVL